MLLSFICNTYDIGEGAELKFMAASLSVECVKPHVFSMSEPHGGIKVVGLIALLTGVPLTLGAIIYSLYPIRHVLETRTERKCSPLVDFMSSRW